MEFIKSLLSGESGTIAQILIVIGIVNGSLAGVSVILASFKDKTENKVDDKIYNVIHSVLHYASVVVDFVSANTKHISKEAVKEDAKGHPKPE